MIDTIERYKEAGIHTILHGKVPYPGPTTAECLTRPNWILSPKTDWQCQETTKDEALSGAHATNGMLLEIAHLFPSDVNVFLPSEPMCSGEPNCDFIDEGGSYYWLNGHLSYYGSNQLAEKYLQPVIATLKQELLKRTANGGCEQLVKDNQNDADGHRSIEDCAKIQ